MITDPGLKLDHFVVHIDNEASLLPNLKTRLAGVKVPFEPDWGKGTKGFKAANIWIGRQYFEIIRILRQNGGGWVERWVERHHRGQRGLYCLFLKTDRLDDLRVHLQEAGVSVPDPERVTYRAFFGLFKKTMPWRMLYLPPIPGTDLELAFIQYDPDPKDVMKAHMVPNADENGITGIHDARLRLLLTEEARTFLSRLFPNAIANGNVLTVPLESGSLRISNTREVHVEFFVTKSTATDPAEAIRFENVTLYV